MNIIAAKAQCFLEADSRHFQTYAREVVESAKSLAKSFMYNDYHVATSGTDSHIVLVDLSNKNISGRQAADILEKNGITVNKNGVPNDPRNFIETSGIRLGTAAEVTRGHDREWFWNLGKKIVEILNENSNT